MTKLEATKSVQQKLRNLEISTKEEGEVLDYLTIDILEQELKALEKGEDNE